MVRNEEHCKAILIENLYCQKVYGARKLMKEFLAKTWKKTALYIINRLKETRDCA